MKSIVFRNKTEYYKFNEVMNMNWRDVLNELKFPVLVTTTVAALAYNKVSNDNERHRKISDEYGAPTADVERYSGFDSDSDFRLMAYRPEDRPERVYKR